MSISNNPHLYLFPTFERKNTAKGEVMEFTIELRERNPIPNIYPLRFTHQFDCLLSKNVQHFTSCHSSVQERIPSMKFRVFELPQQTSNIELLSSPNPTQQG